VARLFTVLAGQQPLVVKRADLPFEVPGVPVLLLGFLGIPLAGVRILHA
jgi:hypothetical protein